MYGGPNTVSTVVSLGVHYSTFYDQRKPSVMELYSLWGQVDLSLNLACYLPAVRLWV